MDPWEQSDQGSLLFASIIKTSLKHLNICSRHIKQTTFSGQKYWQDKGLNLHMAEDNIDSEDIVCSQ